ncbi:partner of bursicon-like [Limulus polyphemus]|uniref:Partner of bursicon-like n=1 Tax=Limulus polyphemus TaxID=6850 RepID=A0ABM1BM59_LIMPO|nr:partner of bursicon-like [Limulus polyphemus]
MRKLSSISCFVLCLILTSNTPLFQAHVQDLSDLTYMRTMEQSTCTTHHSQIHISEEEQDEAGNMLRVCGGTVAVAKCEGTCVSLLQPSARNPSGFVKDCRCCREAIMELKTIELKECFRSDGNRIYDSEGTMTIHLEEPAECACHECGH